jgi:hypothetical protein
MSSVAAGHARELAPAPLPEASSLFIRGQALEARRLTSDALAAGVGTDRERLLLAVTDALASAALGEPTAAAGRIRELLGRARRLGDRGVLCRCLVGSRHRRGMQGQLASAHRYGAEAVRIAETLPVADMAGTTAHSVHGTWVLAELDRLPEALATMQRSGGSRETSPISPAS